MLDEANVALAENAQHYLDNPFDVIGAVSAGMKSAWVKRSDTAVFDPWGVEPTVTVKSLNELCEKVDSQKEAANP